MPHKQDPRYEQARRTFDELDIEEQASFLVEATASTLARGILEVGTRLADSLEEAIACAQQSSTAAEQSGPGPAEPETAQSRSSRSGSSDAPAA